MIGTIGKFVWTCGLLAALSAGSALAADNKAKAPARAEPAAAAPAAPAPAPEAAPLAPSAPMAATPPTTPAAPAAHAEGAENPYGLAALWSQGDMVAKMTLAILVIMSISSWYVIFSKYQEQRRVMKQATQVQEGFWAAKDLRAATQGLQDGSAYQYIAQQALEGSTKFDRLQGAIPLNEWLSMSVQRAMGGVQNRLQDGLALLATVGSTAPFVGLFGTVWGIYNALVKIGMSGQASIDKVAGPVGESLIMTAIGLAVAVPAVLGYNWLVRRNKSVMEGVSTFGADLHAVLLAEAKR